MSLSLRPTAVTSNVQETQVTTTACAAPAINQNLGSLTVSSGRDIARREPSETGGIREFIEKLQQATREGATSGDLTQIDTLLQDFGSFVNTERDLAIVRAEAKLELANSLHGRVPSFETDRAWLELLEDLRPGPYGKYILRSLDGYACNDGPVRTRLQKIQADWQNQYGNKITYQGDLDLLQKSLEQKRPSIVDRIIMFLWR